MIQIGDDALKNVSQIVAVPQVQFSCWCQTKLIIYQETKLIFYQETLLQILVTSPSQTNINMKPILQNLVIYLFIKIFIYEPCL